MSNSPTLIRIKSALAKSVLPEGPVENGFLVRSVLVMCILGALIIAPFSWLNFYQGRSLIGIASVAVLVVCVLNTVASFRGKYVLWLNLWGAAPALAFSIVFAIEKLGVIGTFWTYMALCTYYLILPLKYAVKAAIVLFVVASVTAFFYVDVKVLVRFMVTSLGCGSFMYFCFREIENQRNLLSTQSLTDPLTGAFNRQSLQDTLAQFAHQQHVNDTTSTLCMFDIDHFKHINDDFGHDVGDKVLKAFSAIITQHMRSDDKLFRVGGEEFLLLMPNTTKTHAASIAECIRETLSSSEIISGHPVTVSVGVAESDKHLSWREWMKNSDDKLYFSKQNGRNQVSM
ncbi:GGDEF domain-containing protein [Glaciecola siphonariae]|uniref:diguanylate cyclase n=1 Tax=Glaciecola siphonariae TaxID=521012 RepID=A0ABV9LX13_9ALTE